MKITHAVKVLVITGLTGAMLSACSDAGDASGNTGGANDSVSIRLALGDPAGSAVANAAEHFAEQADELSDGAVKVEVFTDGTLFGGDQNAAVNLLANGSLDATIISTSVYASFEPRMNAISLPFLFDDADEFTSYLTGEPGQELLTSLEDQGISGLSLLTRTPRVITNSKLPIEGPSDLDGVKLRVPQNELWVKFFGELGANPTPMDFKEVYTALQLGTIDGQENALEVPVSNKLFEVQDYLSMTNHISDAWVLGFNQEKFEGYSPEVQDILREAGTNTFEWKREADDAQVEKNLVELEEQGITINELSDEAREEFAQRAEDLYPTFEGLIGQEFMQKSLDFVGR